MKLIAYWRLEYIKNSKNGTLRKQTTKLKVEQGTDRFLKKKYKGSEIFFKVFTILIYQGNES